MLRLIETLLFLGSLQGGVHALHPLLLESAQSPLRGISQGVNISIHVIKLIPKGIDLPLVRLLMISDFSLALLPLMASEAPVQTDIDFLHLNKILAFVFDASKRLLAFLCDPLSELLGHRAVLLLSIDIVRLPFLHRLL